MTQAVAVIVFEPSAEESLAKWVKEDIFVDGLRENVHTVLYVPAAALDGSTGDETGAFLSAATAAMRGYLTSHGKGDASLFAFLIVAVFWDGQSEPAKASFAALRQLTDDKSAARKSLSEAVGDLQKKQGEEDNIKIEVLVQALNAKKNTHTMRDNRVALITSMQKKLASSQLIAAHGTAPMAASSSAAAPSPGSDGSGRSPNTPAASIGEADISPEAVSAAVENGQGECFFVIAAESRDAFAQRAEELKRNSASVEVELCPVMTEPREVKLPRPAGSPSGSGGAAAPAVVVAQEFLLRRSRPGHHIELRLAMCGNVDSGKSTLTSVLTRGVRDDGRGAARAFVFNHRHEALTGRTSSISENHLGFSGTGTVVNYELGDGKVDEKAASAAAAAASRRPFTPQELASRSAKVLTMYDLAGHERYLKTTVLGMTRNMPDYACIVISANNGIQRMTKEHLALCLALKLPFFIAVTRIDATPETVHKETMTNIHKLLKIPTVRKLPYPITKPDELILAAKKLRDNTITPIFEISNVTGQGIPGLLHFLNLLPLRKDWRAARAMPREMVIDSTFFVTGVGTVVGGIVTQGVFHVNDTVLLGPDGFGNYRPVSIKSIHVKGVDSPSVEAGNDAAFCLKKEKRSAIRKGNILADPAAPPLAFWQFEAEITILYHSTTITTDYEPVIHSTTVRQSARMTYVAQEVLRTGDKSIVRFHFLYRPEFMKEAQRLIFREGRTKGIGVVTRLIKEADEALLARSKVRKALLNRPDPAHAAATTAAKDGRKK